MSEEYSLIDSGHAVFMPLVPLTLKVEPKDDLTAIELWQLLTCCQKLFYREDEIPENLRRHITVLKK